MSDNFKEFKEKNDICKVIEAATGQTAVQEGNGTKRLKQCPFSGCESKTCFTIYDETQSFCTFACNTAKGDVHNFLQAYYNLEPYDALVKGCELTGFQLTHSKQTPQTAETKIRDCTVNYYNDNLLNNSQALTYQTQTRCHNIETLKYLKIGFTNGCLHQYLTAKGYSLDEQLNTGLVVKKDGKIKDYFVKGVYIYPHKTLDGDYGHFTIKDPNKKYSYQLPNEYKNDGCVFYNMSVLKKSDEIFIVEGENDLTSLIEAGQKNVIAINGQISREQIDYLRKLVDQDNKPRTIYLCFDNNDAGQKYTQALINAFDDRCYVDLLNYELRTDNLTLKIIQFDKAVDIDEYLVKHCGTDHEKKKEKFEALKKNAKQHMMLLRNQIELYKDAIDDKNKNADPGNKIKPNNIFIGKICAKYFKYAGAYFVEPDNGYQCNIFYDNHIYEISDNPIFNAMMNRTAGLNASQNGFKVIRQEMLDTAINTGKKVKIPGWITAKRTTNTIFINLCNERNELLKLSPGEIEIIKNGSNQDSVYLRNASNMEEINPDIFENEIYIREGMSELKTLLFDNFPCALVNKYYLFVYMIASFFVNFFKAKGLLKASGDTGSGKTTSANIITHLIYKKDMTTIGTPASFFTEAAISPITVMDNYEQQNIDRSILAFLLFVATGGKKMKRDRDRQTSNIYERASTQIYWTAIEPPEKGELINRTIDIQFNERYWKEDFLETEITDLIIEKRDQLLSTIFKLTAFKILPDFKNKHSKAIKWLNTRFKGHSKKRLNEMLATYSVILKEVCNYIPYTEAEEGVASHVAIVSKWIEMQNEIAKDVSINTDPVIRYVGYLLNAYKYDEVEFKTNFPEIQVEQKKQVESEQTGIESFDPSNKKYKSISFDFKYDDLYTFIGMESKRIGEKNPFTSSGNLKSGLRKANKALKSAGWNFEGEVKEKRNSHYRIYRLTKTFELEPGPF